MNILCREHLYARWIYVIATMLQIINDMAVCQQTVLQTMQKGKLLLHISRPNSIYKEQLHGTVEGEKRRRGRSRKMWLDNTKDLLDWTQGRIQCQRKVVFFVHALWAHLCQRIDVDSTRLLYLNRLLKIIRYKYCIYLSQNLTNGLGSWDELLDNKPCTVNVQAKHR